MGACKRGGFYHPAGEGSRHKNKGRLAQGWAGGLSEEGGLGRLEWEEDRVPEFSRVFNQETAWGS